MKTRIFTLALFATIASCAYAQTENPNYLNKAMASLESGDCKSAQMFYNVYKELSGKSMTSIEALITDCLSKNDTTKSYTVGELMKINGYYYKVAHVEPGGHHGFAIYDLGGGKLQPEMIQKRTVPTRSEMALVYKNRAKLNLIDGDYWTIDGYDSSQYYYARFQSSLSWSGGNATNPRGILLIYRF